MKTGRRASWTLAGIALGVLVAGVLWAPAGWLASGVAEASGQRLLLADARGTIWNGSAVAVLTGGAGSRDASALPGRLQWRLRPGLRGLQLQAQHDCCINGTVALAVRPGLGRVVLELPPPAAGSDGVLGQWPASWLAGLGTPWNTLQPSGSLQLRTGGLVVELVQGRWRLQGQAELAVNAFASRLSTLDVLGSYTLVLAGAPAGAGVAGEAGATLQLATTSGALLLQGQGQWVGDRLRFDGEARAAPGSEAVLANLLNIIGRRQGERSVISIG